MFLLYNNKVNKFLKTCHLIDDFPIILFKVQEETNINNEKKLFFD